MVPPAFRERSGLAQEKIDYPTPANVFARLSAVVQDVVMVAPGVLKGVRENGHHAEVARLVHLGGERNGGVGAPERGEADRAKRVTENVVEQSSCGPVQGTHPRQLATKPAGESKGHPAFWIDAQRHADCGTVGQPRGFEGVSIRQVGKTIGLGPVLRRAQLLFGGPSVREPLGHFDRVPALLQYETRWCQTARQPPQK